MASDLQSALAKAAASTKRACATSADVVKAANPSAKLAATGAKASVFAHSVYLSAFGGVIIGITAYYLVNKYWLSKDNAVEADEQE